MKFSAFTYFAAFGIKTILFRQKKPILGTVILTDKCNLKCKLNSTATGDDIVKDGFIFPGSNGVLDSSASGDDIIKEGFLIGDTPYLVNYDVIDQEGIPGQGNANPPGIFKNHFIVRYSGVYYDPSYGSGGFPSSTAHEEASIDGICIVLSSYQVAKKKGTSVELSYNPTSL